MMAQLPLFPELTAQFPSTRYQGSKAKLVGWIMEQLAGLHFQTCLDAFGGTGAVAYALKQAGKSVTYNDLLHFNHEIGKALIENSRVQLAEADINAICQIQASRHYPDFIQRTFKDIYFTDAENHWLDCAITHIQQLPHPHQKALAFFALAQACIVKRPYNLFHRKNLYIRFAKVERSFGNKTSWDKPFDVWFWVFAQEANAAVFDNGQVNRALCGDALAVAGDYDLVYLDPPYISGRGVGLDYRDFYHFLEGLTCYAEWHHHLDWRSKHHRLKREPNPWHDKHKIIEAFDALFARFQKSVLVVSYRSDGIPSETELIALLKRYKSKVQVARYENYQYALSKNTTSAEILLIGT